MKELRIPDMMELDPFPAAFARNFWRPWRDDGAMHDVPQIRLDLTENDKSYEVKAEIPGVRKEDIDVRIDGRQVTISAEVKKETDEKQGGRVLRSERRQGFASRSFQFDHEVDAAAAQAHYDSGVLTLSLPKKAAAGGRRLAIG